MPLSSDRTTAPLRILMADPVHNWMTARDIWVIPLNILSIAAALRSRFGRSIEVSLFKFPDEAIESMEASPPHVLATSNYIWNFELSKVLLRKAKRLNPETITVMGGPNADFRQAWMSSMMEIAQCDYYVSGSGELAFPDLIEMLLLRKKADCYSNVPGCWHYDKITHLATYSPQERIISNLDDLPSPFTQDLALPFFQRDLFTNIETTRGCPFHCTYCNWGDATHGKVLAYSVDRIKADLDICREQARDERLMLSDANFGILGVRDLEIAEYIRSMHDTYGWPGKVILTWGQLKSKTSLEIARILSGLCMMTQSSQSMSPAVLKNIRRRNISEVDWKKTTAFCKENSITSYGELMVPLPGETMDSYLKSLRFLFSLPVDFINTNPLMLLHGAEMNSPRQKKEFGFQTRWRLLEGCYGLYGGDHAVEYQEMVVATKDFAFDDYLTCRALSWLIQMSWNLGFHKLPLQVGAALGVSPLNVFLRLALSQDAIPGAFRTIRDDFYRDAKDELFPDLAGLMKHTSESERLNDLRHGGFKKLNTHYTARVLMESSKEFMDFVELSTASMLPAWSSEQDSKLLNEAVRFSMEKLLDIRDLDEILSGGLPRKLRRFEFDLANWSGLDDHKPGRHEKTPATYEFSIPEVQAEVLRRHMRLYSGISKEYTLRKLYEPYHGIHHRHLTFQVRCLSS